MHSKLIRPIILFTFLLLALPVFYLSNYSQSINLTDQKVVYELPYPGILPDHPLYALKVTRDRVLEFFTRDNLKKVNLYLLFSDKRLKMAEYLAKKGKNDLAITTASKGEKYFLKIPPLLKSSKQQGVSPDPSLLERVRLSNKKHKQLLVTLLKELPQGEQQRVEEILQINQNVAKDLKSL